MSLETQRAGANALKIATVISIGQHPKSGRPRRAEQDSRAVELALALAQGGNADLRLMHAGDSSSQDTQRVLREYLGMGIPKMDVIQQPASADVLPALVESLRQQPVDVVLTGTRAESGEGSGMTPYVLAQTLGWPMVPAAVNITPKGDGQFEVLQALPRGQRRLLKVRAPFVASVDPAASEARQSAWASGQRADIQSQPGAVLGDVFMDEAEVQPARKRPKRIATAKKAKSAADRFKAATAKSASKGGVVMQKESNEEKAEAIYQLLQAQGVLR